jgi:hypothetical protein
MDGYRAFAKSLMMRRTAIAASALVACAAIGKADPITITFDPSQSPPPGQIGAAPSALTPASLLSYWGVTFGSSATDDPSVCGDQGPLCFGDTIGTADLGLNFLTDDVLSGSITGSPNLTLTFAAPTTTLDFGAVVGTSTDEVLSVALSGPGFSGTTPEVVLLQATDGAVLSEGEFEYSGTPITQAVITFSSDASAIFAIDNLTYDLPASQAPEPKTFVFFSLGLISVGLFSGFRRAVSLDRAEWAIGWREE